MYDLSAVALSGGADSTALTYLLVQHAKSHQRDLRSILAVPIDHGLRPGSSAEAEKVSRWARSLGLSTESEAIPWGRPPFPARPSTAKGIEALARASRIELFIRIMRKHGIRELFMGHHADDQVETALMLQDRRPATPLGVHGMRAVSRLPPSRLGARQMEDEKMLVCRPLLGVRKSDILALCKAENLPYVDDPTNSDPAYTKRNALRHCIRQLEERATSSADPDIGPAHALRKWEERVSARRDNVEAKVTALLKAVQLDAPAPSAATFLASRLTRELPSVRRAFAVRLFGHVSPSSGETISARNLDIVERAIFQPWLSEKPVRKYRHIFPGGGAVCRHLGADQWLVARQALNIRRKEDEKLAVHLDSSENLGRWIEWDGRFWLRVTPLPERSPSACNLPTGWRIKPSGKYVLPSLCIGEPSEAGSGEPLWQMSEGDPEEGSRLLQGPGIRIEWNRTANTPYFA